MDNTKPQSVSSSTPSASRQATADSVPPPDASGELRTPDGDGRWSTARPDLSRRRVLGGAALTGVALPILAACGGGEEPSSTTGEENAASGDGATETPADQGGEEPTGNALAKTSEIPVEGGKVYPEQQVVVVQTEAGSFKAFSAICTHMRCTVSGVEDGSIICRCHQSRFSVTDGSVQSGPAPAPLPERAITVEGDSIILA